MKGQKLNTKSGNGITLIALIITIVVLLILAVVAIGAVKESGIITHAQKAATDYNSAKADEESKIEGYEALIESKLPGENGDGGDTTIKTVAEAQAIGVLSTSTTTDVKDEYGNIIKLPAGFKITTDSNNVTEGIVIEDCTETATKGSQFVWIPVGIVYTSVNQASGETINLDRYTFASDGTATPQGDAVIEENATIGDSYQEIQTSTYGNATAKDLSGFISSAKTNKGYYLARYEAGTETLRSSSNDKLTQLIVKSNVNVYNYVTQLQASSLSQGMYENNEETNVVSDLINSYAWDTAIEFIQTFSTESDASTYSILNKSTSISVTGENGDEYCKINDMSGNVKEYTTETCFLGELTCAYRGGQFSYGALSSGPSGVTRSRGGAPANGYVLSYISFRPLLYL